MFLGALIYEGFCEVKFDHSIRLRFSAHFFGLWTAHWWWRSSHAAGGDPSGVLKRVPTCPRFHLSGSWEGCRWFGGPGNCGNATWAYCSRSTLSSLSCGLQDLEVKKNSMDEANEAVAFGWYPFFRISFYSCLFFFLMPWQGLTTELSLQMQGCVNVQVYCQQSRVPDMFHKLIPELPFCCRDGTNNGWKTSLMPRHFEHILQGEYAVWATGQLDSWPSHLWLKPQRPSRKPFFFCLPRFTAVSRTVFLIFMAGGIGSVQLSSDVNLPQRVWEVGGKS